MNINELKEQHVNLLDIAVDFSESMEKGQTCDIIQDIRKFLVKLEDEIVAHLICEDEILYPVLKRCTDKSVQNMAVKFEEEMGDIKTRFTEYLKKWESNSNIVNNSEQFQKETSTFLIKLTRRIVHEESKLFPLLSV